MTTPPPTGVRRGARVRAGFQAFRTGMRQGLSAEICAALRSDPQGAQEFSTRSELFKTLEEAQTRGVQATSSRLALAGLTATEVGVRLEEIRELRQTLGEVN